MVTEPGSLCKFGMNSDGVGVSSATVQCRERVAGVPMAVLVRAALDRPSAAEAAGVVMAAARQNMGCLLIGDGRGAHHMLEMYGPNLDAVTEGKHQSVHVNAGSAFEHMQDEVQSGSSSTHTPVVVHTNHYLTSSTLMHVCGGNEKQWKIEGSVARYNRLHTMLRMELDSDVDTLKRLLGDQDSRARQSDSGNKWPIQIPYHYPILEEPEYGEDDDAGGEEEEDDSSDSDDEGSRNQKPELSLLERLALEEQEEAAGGSSSRPRHLDLSGNISLMGCVWNDSAPMKYGTLCSVTMDLRNMVMHLTRGSPFDVEYEELIISNGSGGGNV